MERLFHDPNVPRTLLPAILERVSLARCRSARIKLAFQGGMTIVSIAALIPASEYTIAEFRASGFYEYLSLAFSDGAMLAYWRELGLSLIESTPSIALILLSVLLCALFVSLYGIIRNAPLALRPLHTT